MNYSKISGYFESSNGTDRIAYYVYRPEGEIRAAVQLVHGMCEYCERYEDFIDFLCGHGIMVFCHDHLGHGNSVRDREHLGYFAPERGWHFLAKDVVKLTRLVREKCRNVKLFILGHSMGSLVVRTVLAKYGYMYDGAVIMGTVNTRIGTDAGIVLTRSIGKIKGDMYRSKFLDEVVFGLNNIKIENPISEYSWISCDDEIVKKYEKDPLCNFHFTVRAYSDLMFLVNYVSRNDWAGKIDRDLPIFICSGDADPVGLYGLAPQNVFNALNKAGLKDLELKIYSKMRHEILNEVGRGEVYHDLLDWFNSRMYDVTADGYGFGEDLDE
ncbi:MAG: lysophospholipase [Ruminococcus sp.]|nr:lysophospholipase [Ruminococcus sp.]MCM1381931.1 lysophospholipase [Muribaculaceae bacterium]MCM1480632.1 lysophospholipase [Muribaculaceae bacterium]